MPRLLFFLGLSLINLTLVAQVSYPAKEFAKADRERELEKQISQGKPPSVLGDTKNYTDPKLFPTNGNGLGSNASIGYASFPLFKFSPKVIKAETTIPIPVSTLKIIDARLDIDKVTFMPVNTEIQKKGFSIMGMQIAPTLSGWLKDAFADNYFETDSNNSRSLVIAIKKFWFSNSANQVYTFSNPALLTNLHYEFDIYTFQSAGYYPQKNIKGILTTYHKNGNAYTVLTDSLLTILKKEIAGLNYSIREKETNWVSPVDFNDYYKERISKKNNNEKIVKGVYETFADFLEKKVSSDSVDMIKRYNNNGMFDAFACQINAFKSGVHVPVNQSWGYFDGKSLFVNAGNGFFIKLNHSNNGYEFTYLQGLQKEPIKRYVLAGLKIGDSDYLVLKDYTKAYALTFQLDMDTGKLY